MIFKASDIQVINAAIVQFNDMIENGSEDERHQKYHDGLIDLLKRAKSFKRAKKIVITQPQINAIYDQISDCESMIGCGDDESDRLWVKRINMINRMFAKNGLPTVGSD